MVEPRLGLGPATVEEAADYRSLHAEGVETILEVAAETVAVDGWGFRSPSTTLLVVVRTRLVRSRDNAELYGHRILFRSPSVPWREWITASHALAVQQLDRACEALSERVAEEVLSVYLAPSWRSPR